jgi:hypothetical protein
MIVAILIEITETAATAAIPLAPIRTGSLRRSIRSDVDKNSLRAFVVAGSAQVNYAGYQEFGTYERGINPDNFRAILGALRGGLGISAVRTAKGIAPKLYVHRGVYNSLTRFEVIAKQKMDALIREVAA